MAKRSPKQPAHATDEQANQLAGMLRRVADELERRGAAVYRSESDVSSPDEQDLEGQEFEAILTDVALPGEDFKTFAECLTVGEPGQIEAVLIIHKSVMGSK